MTREDYGKKVDIFTNVTIYCSYQGFASLIKTYTLM